MWKRYYAGMGSQLTIRGVTAELHRRLAQLGKSGGESVNAIALRILNDAVGGTETRRGRLEPYMTWSLEDLSEFETELRAQRVTDRRVPGGIDLGTDAPSPHVR